MKVALFHGTLPAAGRRIGGVEISIHRLANALVQSGVDVTFISSSPKPEGALYKHRLFFDGKFRGILKGLTTASIALNFLDLSDFDVIHLHGDDWFYVRRPIPSVRTLHGSALYEARTATSWKRKLIQYAIYPLEHLAARLATVAMAVGTETQQIYGLKHLADNGVDITLFHPGEKSPTPLLFYMGTWKGRKRGEFAYETFLQHVLPQFPDAQLYMISDGVPAHPNVIDGKFPETAELASWLRRSWVFMYPSIYEGFGIPYIEAMASATAIVTTPNSGAQYVLDQGTYGCLAADAEFGATVTALLADPAMRGHFEHAGLERSLYFSWPNVAQRHMEVYEEALGHPPGTAF